ncbi:hypothetical protein ANTQUA_LOCUS5365 [Anthophora quadrimaculata]
MAESERSQDQIDQQLFDTFNVDRSTRVKRPFCNAFTGCGRKRSLYHHLAETQELKSTDIIRLPFSVYKALLKAAQRGCIKNTIDQDENEYQSSDIPQVFLSGKIPIQNRFDIPLTSLD